MEEKDLTESSNNTITELKKTKSNRIIDAVLIGFLIGIIFYSVVKNTWGFLTLIPLFLIYKIVNKSKRKTSGDL